MNDTSFTIDLTVSELLAATAVLGLSTISLLGESSPTEDELESQIAEGCRLLQERQLLKPVSAVKWQVDSLLAVLIHWLVNPDSLIQIDSWSLTRESHQLALHFWQKQLLVIEKADKTYHCTFWPSPLAWLAKQIKMDEGPIASNSPTEWQIPPLDLQSILPRLQEQETAVRALMEQKGLTATAVEQAIAHLSTINQVETWSWLSGQQPNQAKRQLLCLHSPATIWAGEVSSTNQWACLYPYTTTDWQQILDESANATAIFN